MTYAQFYARMKALSGNRTDIDDQIKIWSQDAVMLAYTKSLNPGGIALGKLDFTESETLADVYMCGTALGNAVSEVSYVDSGGNNIRLEHQPASTLMSLGAECSSYPTGFTRVESAIYLLPRLTAAPATVFIMGAVEFPYPWFDGDDLPIVTSMIPGATALATVFMKIYLGEVEQAQALQALSSALLALDLGPKGLEDRVGAWGMKVIR